MYLKGTTKGNERLIWSSKITKDLHKKFTIQVEQTNKMFLNFHPNDHMLLHFHDFDVSNAIWALSITQAFP